MKRKEKLLQDFLAHPIIQEKYKFSERRMPKNIEEALTFSSPIIKALANIIVEVEGYKGKSEREVYQLITKLLNESPL